MPQLTRAVLRYKTGEPPRIIQEKYDTVRIECMCGRMNDVRPDARVINHKCRCGVEYMISQPLEHMPANGERVSSW